MVNFETGSYNNLAANLNRQARYAEAEPLFRHALAIHKALVGDDHRHTATCYSNLASNLDDQGRYGEAEPLARQGLAIRLRLLGENHPDVAGSCNNIATNLNRQGKYAEAEPLLRRALAIYQKALGEEHPSTTIAYANLAVNMADQGRHGEAEPLHRRALASSQRMLGEDHPDTAARYSALASNLRSQRRSSAADLFYRRALAIREKTLGADHPDTAESCISLAMVLDDQQLHAEAEPLLRQALAIKQKSLGEDHPDTARAHMHVANIMDKQGRHAEAEPILRRALEVCQKTLGEGHPDTMIAYRWLVVHLKNRGQYEAALPPAQAAARSFELVRQHVGFGGLERSAHAVEWSPFPRLCTVLARLQRPAEAWQALERSLAPGLLDDLTARQRRAATEDERRRQLELDGRLDHQERQWTTLINLKNPSQEQIQRREEARLARDRLLAERAQFQADLEKQHGPAAGAVFDLPRIQQHVPAHAALVAWLDLRHQVKTDPQGDHWACVVRSSGPPIWVRLRGSGANHAWTQEDAELPSRLLKLLHHQPGDERARLDLTRRLAAQRLAPLAEHLDGVRHLIVLPSSALAGIPIETLTDQYRISYALSGTMFAYLREKQPPTRSSDDQLLALGDPVFLPAPTARPRPTPPVSGVAVLDTVPSHNGHAAGIRAGDVILRYGGTVLAQFDDLKTALGQNTQPVKIDLWRDGQTIQVTVQPGTLGIRTSIRPPAEVLAARWAAEDAARSSSTGSYFTPLAGTRREVEAIANLFPAHRLLLGSDASEAQLDALARGNGLKDYRYLHLATHGKADSERGLRSFLALAQDAQANPLAPPGAGQKPATGRLSAADILAGWQLDADLVTLSACETALGQLQGGEGYVGFAQAFLLVGARSLVLSQWKVDDQATALLMERFYQNLRGQRPGLAQPMGKAAALAEAKNWLRTLTAQEVQHIASRQRGSEVEVPQPVGTAGDRPYAHPYYWAAFILIGDPGDMPAVSPAAADAPLASLTPASPESSTLWPWVLGAILLAAVSSWLFIRKKKSAGSGRRLPAAPPTNPDVCN